MNSPAENRARVAVMRAEGKNMPLGMTGDEIRHAEKLVLTSSSRARGKTEFIRGWRTTRKGCV